MKKIQSTIIILLFGLFLTACSVQTIKTQTMKPVPSPGDKSHLELNQNYWWYVRFKMVWDNRSDQVDFSRNLIIAHQIINPVLNSYDEQIKLWRVHRRAVNDSAGHQFSFIFYAPANTAELIFEQVRNHPVSKQLIQHQILQKIYTTSTKQTRRPNIEDTSDKHWTKSIQKSWPYYIMGVSILWLDLLNQEAIKINLDSTQSIESQMQQYQNIHISLTEQWKSHAKHAYFHHISGIFGYEPIEVRY